MHGIVVREINRVAETIPISAMFRSKVAQTSEDGSVESLSFPIRQRKISCREQLPNTQDSANVLEELGGELPPLSESKWAGGLY